MSSDSESGPVCDELDDEAVVDDACDDSKRNRSCSDLPYVLRRDSAKDGRKMVPLFLREEFQCEESEFRAAVAEELGKDADEVWKFDLREAMYRAALDDPEGVAAKLVEDGYDLR